MSPFDFGKVPFRGSVAVTEGLIDRRALYERKWRRLLHDVFIQSSVPMDHGLMCRAALLIMPVGSVVVGRSAAWLHGVRFATTNDPVEVWVPHEPRMWDLKGIRIFRSRLDQIQIDESKNLLVTNPVSTALHLARHCAPGDEAVVFLDALLRATRTNVEKVKALIPLTHPRPRGYTRAARILTQVDPRSESPQETKLRLKLADSGLLQPDLQHAIYNDAGRFVARVDFAWPEKKVALEYDGLWHGKTSQLHYDRRRLNKLQLAEWVVLHATIRRVRDEFPALIAELRGALAR